MSAGKAKSAGAASSAAKQAEQKPEESKEDLVEQVLELHTVLKGIVFSCCRGRSGDSLAVLEMGQRIEGVKSEKMKLFSENQILSEYITNITTSVAPRDPTTSPPAPRQ